MPARLVVHFADAPTRRFALAEGRPQVVGRDAACDVVIDDDRVSRRHARFDPDGATWRLSDLGSKNGTRVDGRPADGTALVDGAWLGFGDLLVRFETLSAERWAAESRGELERWRTSIGLGGHLDPSVGLEGLLRQVLRSILDVAGCRRGFVLLTLADGGLELAARAGVDAEELVGSRFAGSAGAVERALTSGEPVALADASLDTVLGARASIVDGGVRALVCLPLRVMDRLIGVVYADGRETGSAFSELDIEILSALASHAALAIGVARLHREVADVHRVMPAGDTVASSATPWDRSLPAYRSTGDWRRSLTLDPAVAAEPAE